MTKEFKYVSLGDFKAISDGAGGFEGYISKWGELDDGADIVAQGAHVDTLEQFLKRGFTTDSHDWSFGDGVIGYPIAATEDAIGTRITARYHSDPKSQAVRTKVNERQAAGMDVLLSIGYEPSAPPIFIDAKDYATEIPKYSKPDLVEANLTKAAKFSRVRVLLKNHLYEGAIVPVPMLGSAGVTSAKSGADEGTEVKDAAPPAGATFAEEGETVLAAVKAYVTRAKDIQTLRLKEGRVFSAANRAVIANAKDALMDLASVLDELLAMSEPKQDEEGGKAARIQAARKAHIEALVREALRQQQGAYANGN